MMALSARFSWLPYYEDTSMRGKRQPICMQSSNDLSRDITRLQAAKTTVDWCKFLFCLHIITSRRRRHPNLPWTVLYWPRRALEWPMTWVCIKLMKLSSRPKVTIPQLLYHQTRSGWQRKSNGEPGGQFGLDASTRSRLVTRSRSTTIVYLSFYPFLAKHGLQAQLSSQPCSSPISSSARKLFETPPIKMNASGS